MAYGRRWSIEDLFNQLKNRWGWKDSWQQTRQVLHRWTQIIATSYALPQLLALQGGCDVQNLAALSPWRNKHPLTAGRVRQGLQKIFGYVDIRSLWNPKDRKIRTEKYSKRAEKPPDR